MGQQYLPAGRTGADVQRVLSEASEILEAGSGQQIGDAVSFLVEQKARLKARNASAEASARLYAAQNFR